MIDDAAIRKALMDVLVAGPIPAEDIKRLGEHFQPPSRRPHLRVSLVWHRKRRSGAVLTEAEGMWQVLVYAPQGTAAEAVEALAKSLGELYEPHVDGAELAGMIRITEVVTLTTVDVNEQGDGGGVTPWVVTPLQVDFRLALVPVGLT